MTAPPPPEAPRGDIDDGDLGTPITELRGLMLPVDDRFTPRLHNRLDRRLLAGNVLDFLWTGPILVLLELLRLPFERFSGRPRS